MESAGTGKGRGESGGGGGPVLGRSKWRCTREEAEEATTKEQALLKTKGMKEVDAESDRNADRATRRRRKKDAATVTELMVRGSHDGKGDGTHAWA